MEYVKKQPFNGIRICDNKEAATHVMQTKAEYAEMIDIASMYRSNLQKEEKKERELQKKIVFLQSENEKLKEQASSLQSEVLLSSQTSDEISALEQEKEALIARIASLEDAVSQEKNLNKNLIRIARERANADRSISPKKQHDGYIVLQSREWRERLPDKTIMRTWKSFIQTPFDASLNPTIAERQIFEDLISFVLTDIGCEKYVLPEDNGHCFRSEDGENVLYCWRYIQDYRSGYWNILIYTTLPLIVPPERRARQHWDRKKRPHS